MIKDPIVEEVRKAGQDLSMLARNDLHTFFENLRLAEQKYRDRLVSTARDPVQQIAKSRE